MPSATNVGSRPANEAVIGVDPGFGSPSLWAPEFTAESAWFEHAPFAFWLMEQLRPRILAELGTHRGYSYFAFCQAVRRLGLETRCFALDSWEGDDHAGFYGDEVYLPVAEYNDAHYADFSRLLRGYFETSLDKFEDGTIDLLHLDGRHGYDDIVDDYRSWEPKLSSRSVVLFHDTNVHEREFGVWKFWEEVSREHPSFAFEHGHGLGVLLTGTNLPASVSRLADPAGVPAIRALYAELGGRISAPYWERQALADQLGRERLRADLAETALNQVRSSTSWRATRPLRWVSERIRRSS